MRNQSTLEILAFTDPVCTWCWGSEPVLRKVESWYGGAVRIRQVMGGLVEDIRAFHDRANGIGGDPERTNQQVVDMIDAYAQVLERSAAMLGAQFAGPLPKGISGDAAQANQAVEAFTHSTGAVATVFARQGDNFVRIATTLKNDKGERTVGTSLVTTHPAFSLIKSGKTYTGPATLFGQEYMTHYTPLLDAAGQVHFLLLSGERLMKNHKNACSSIKKVNNKATYLSYHGNFTY